MKDRPIIGPDWYKIPIDLLTGINYNGVILKIEGR
jgi:hypothetical protein